jgi:hypothetical protein
LSSNTSSLSSPAISPQTGNSPVQKNGVQADSTNAGKQKEIKSFYIVQKIRKYTVDNFCSKFNLQIFVMTMTTTSNTFPFAILFMVLNLEKKHSGLDS